MRAVNAIRITGGTLRGHSLPVPPKVRPTEARVREALFSIWGERIGEARFLDLFAGSGVVALEAVSRGALEVTCVEGDLRAVRVLQKSCRRLARGAVEVRRASLPGGLGPLAADRGGSYDLAFADPPYRFTAYGALLAAAAPLLAAAGEIAVEHSSRTRLPEEAGPLLSVDHRRYGESSLSFYRRKNAISSR
jgi:16S rRNA (guanine966-N2)-methyltransferase